MSDVGRVRKNNEDSFAIADLTSGEAGGAASFSGQEMGPLGALFMVADGMGGEAGGEVASSLATATVPARLHENLKSLGNLSRENFVILLREAIEYANQVILEKASTNPACRGMGTTTTAAALFGQHVYVAQVGDSRCYLIRERKLARMTRDQTFLNYLKDIGAVLPGDPEKDSRKSILTQAVGTSEALDVKITYAPLSQGDLLVVCCDGLYNMIPEAELLESASGAGELPARCKTLIDRANANGGTDNITVILAQFSGGGLPAADPAAAIECKEFEADEMPNMRGSE